MSLEEVVRFQKSLFDLCDVSLTSCRKSRSVSRGKCCCMYPMRNILNVKILNLCEALTAPLRLLSFGATQHGHACGKCFIEQGNMQEEIFKLLKLIL